MSERDRNQGPLEGAENFDETQPSPAEHDQPQGATHANTTSEIDLDWQGNTGATDFLGLEGDLRLGQDAQSSPIQGFEGLASTGEGPQLDSWLLEIEGATAPAAAATGSPANPLEGIDEVFDAAAGAAAATDENPTAPVAAAPPARGGRKLFAVALVLALLSAGGWYWYQGQVQPDGGSVDVATRPTPTNPPKPVPTQGTPTPGTDPATDPAVDPTFDPAEIPDTDPELASATETLPDLEPTISMPDPGTTVPLVDLDPVVTPAAGNPVELPLVTPAPDIASATEPIDPSSLLPTVRFPKPLGSPGPITTTFPNVPVGTPTPRGAPRVTVDSTGHTMPGSVRRATEEDFADLWREERIPTELFDSERRIRTLSVGRVRALVIGGEYFDGTLYAVGQGRIWLDLDLGRISFHATTVRELKRLPPLPVVAGAKKAADPLAGLPYVEVRLPGGTITGRLIGQDGNRVTLVTENGMRAVVDSDDVRPLTSGKTRVLGSLKNLENPPR